MSMNKIRITVCGVDYVVSTDDSEEYMAALAAAAEKEITSMTTPSKGFTEKTAAVFSALVNMDRAVKAERENISLKKRAEGGSAAWHAKYSAAEKENRQLCGRLKACENKNIVLEKENEALGTCNDELIRVKAHLAAAEKENRQLCGRLKASENKNIALEKENEALGTCNDELMRVKARLAAAERDNRRINAELSRCISENKELTAAAEKNNENKSEQSSLKIRMEILEGKIKLYEAERIRNENLQAHETKMLKSAVERLEEKSKALEKENNLLKKRPDFKGEQLVIENTVSPSVTVPLGREYIYADKTAEKAAKRTNADKTEKHNGDGAAALSEEQAEVQLPGQFSLIASDDENVCLYNPDTEKDRSVGRRRGKKR